MPDLITLPDAETITARLTAVSDSAHAVQYLYPKIAACAGETKAPDGIELIVRLAVYDYAGNLPPQMTAMHELLIPLWVKALAGPDA